jgi:hypothetical protein
MGSIGLHSIESTAFSPTSNIQHPTSSAGTSANPNEIVTVDLSTINTSGPTVTGFVDLIFE